MPLEATPLRYPDHYPPTERWKKFFIGVRVLGPDLSFFPALEAQQAARTAIVLEAWGGGTRQENAAVVGAIFARRLGWCSPYFLPADALAVILGGPAFDRTDSKDAFDAINEVEEQLGVSLPKALWRPETPLADLVDACDAR